MNSLKSDMGGEIRTDKRNRGWRRKEACLGEGILQASWERWQEGQME